MKNIFSVRGYPSFFILKIFSSSAMWMDFTLVFSVLSFWFQSTPRVLGFAVALYGLPSLLIGPFVGALADRSSPVRLMLFTAVARFATSISLAFAPTEQIFVLAILLKGISNLGSLPAEQILIRKLLSPKHIVTTTALTATIDQCVKILSPLLAATAAITTNSQSSFLITAVLALATACCVLRLSIVLGWKYTSQRANAKFPDFSTFWKVFREKPTFAISFVSLFSLSLILGLYDSVIVILLREHGLRAGAFGSIISCTAAGAVAAAILLKRLLLRTSEDIMLITSLFGFSLTVISAGFLAATQLRFSLPVVCILWGFNGFFYAVGAMVYSVNLQRDAPPELIGVLSSTGRSMQLVALVAGPLGGASIAQSFGTQWTFLGAGALGLCFAISVSTALLIKISRRKAL